MKEGLRSPTYRVISKSKLMAQIITPQEEFSHNTMGIGSSVEACWRDIPSPTSLESFIASVA